MAIEKYNKVSLTSDIKEALGIQLATSLERKIEQLVRTTLSSGEQLLRRINVDKDTGIRTTDLFFKGGNADLQNIIGEITQNTIATAASKAKRDIESMPMFQVQVGEQDYDVMNDIRFLDAHAKSQTGKNLTSVAGFMNINKITGRGSMGAPVDATIMVNGKPRPAMNVARQVMHQKNDEWLQGRGAASIAYTPAEPAEMNQHLRAKERLRIEAMTQGEEYDDYVMYRQKQANKVDFKRRYAKENPNDPLVKEEAKERREHIARSITTGVSHFIAQSVSEAVKWLSKIYSITKDVGEMVRERNREGARFNMSNDSMREYREFAERRFGKEGVDLFSKAFGAIVYDFANPTMLNESKIEHLAPVMRGFTGNLVGYLTKNAHSPDVIFKDILNTFMSETINKRGGGLDAQDEHDAFAKNLVLLQAYDVNIAKIFEQWWRDYQSTENVSTIWDVYFKDKRFAGVDPGLSTTASRVGAESAQQELTSLLGDFNVLKNQIFERLWNYLSGIFDMLEAIYLWALSILAPDAALELSNQNRMENQIFKEELLAKKGTLESNLQAQLAGTDLTVDDYMKIVKPMYSGSNKEAVIALGRLIQHGLTYDKVMAMQGDTAALMVNQNKIQQIEKADKKDYAIKVSGKDQMATIAEGATWAATDKIIRGSHSLNKDNLYVNFDSGSYVYNAEQRSALDAAFNATGHIRAKPLEVARADERTTQKQSGSNVTQFNEKLEEAWKTQGVPGVILDLARFTNIASIKAQANPNDRSDIRVHILLKDEETGKPIGKEQIILIKDSDGGRDIDALNVYYNARSNTEE